MNHHHHHHHHHHHQHHHWRQFVAAIEEASRLNATVVLGDRDIQVTMARLQEANEEVRRLRRQGAPLAAAATAEAS